MMPADEGEEDDMTIWQIIILGIVQGATEFLPVSSSGHLVLVPWLLGWPTPPLAVDTLLHLGTLSAVLIYFRHDLWRLLIAAWDSLRYRRFDSPDARLAWGLVIGTLPGAIIGYLLEEQFERFFSMPRAVAAFLLLTAVLLFTSDYFARRERTLTHLRWNDALLIGLGQALAIIPGISRSGTTMSVALFLGFKREEAARFSFLLSIPIILGSGLYQLIKLVQRGLPGIAPSSLLAGFLSAALTGYAAIALLLALIRQRGLRPFALYCAAVGILVLMGVLG